MLEDSMDYKNLKKYEGDMVASDLCDAIVEARMCDLPEIRNAAMLLVEDLQSAILNSENLYYFTSNYTRSVYINERFSTFVFDDRYYAEKFVEQHPNLKLDIADISQKEFESFFIALYQQGIEAIDYCNDRSNVTMGIAKYFLSDSYNPNEAPARDLSRFIHLCMQELRNEERQYEKKEDIINLLKRNIIAEALNCNVFIPVQSNAAVTQLKLDGSEQFAAMQLPMKNYSFQSSPQLMSSPT
jgi:hypothetical protein